MPWMHERLRGSEWSPFMDVFFTQQRAETLQLNSKKFTAFYYNSVLIIMLCIWSQVFGTNTSENPRFSVPISVPKQNTKIC